MPTPTRSSRKVAVGLVRCSTDRQEHSIEDQEAEIRAWASATGHELLRVFKDEGVSGSELDRPGVRALLAYLGERSLASGLSRPGGTGQRRPELQKPSFLNRI